MNTHKQVSTAMPTIIFSVFIGLATLSSGCMTSATIRSGSAVQTHVVVRHNPAPRHNQAVARRNQHNSRNAYQAALRRTNVELAAARNWFRQNRVSAREQNQLLGRAERERNTARRLASRGNYHTATVRLQRAQTMAQDAVGMARRARQQNNSYAQRHHPRHNNRR